MSHTIARRTEVFLCAAIVTFFFASAGAVGYVHFSPMFRALANLRAQYDSARCVAQRQQVGYCDIEPVNY